MQTDQIPTTNPDATAIEEALNRIRVAADIVDTIGEALTGKAHANTLILMASDIERAVDTPHGGCAAVGPIQSA